jgi:hypothetical protein
MYITFSILFEVWGQTFFSTFKHMCFNQGPNFLGPPDPMGPGAQSGSGVPGPKDSVLFESVVQQIFYCVVLYNRIFCCTTILHVKTVVQQHNRLQHNSFKHCQRPRTHFRSWTQAPIWVLDPGPIFSP